VRVPGVSRRLLTCSTWLATTPIFGMYAVPTAASMPAHAPGVVAVTGSASGPMRIDRAGGAGSAVAVVTLQASSSSRDALAGKLESISRASSDAGQREELQKGLDQADQQLERYQAQHERIVRDVNRAVEQQNQAAAELNSCAAEIAELSMRS